MGKTKIIEKKCVNVSFKIENDTVYLEEVAVSRTKQFFGKRPETKKKKQKKTQPL